MQKSILYILLLSSCLLIFSDCTRQHRRNRFDNFRYNQNSTTERRIRGEKSIIKMKQQNGYSGNWKTFLLTKTFLGSKDKRNCLASFSLP